MLKVEMISVNRGDVPVLTRVNFTLAAGQALKITGENGAGKSTLLRVAAGLRLPDAGVVTWCDTPIAQDWSAHAQRVAYLGHRDGLKLDLTVKENLKLFGKGRASRVEAALDQVGLTPMRDDLTRHLSAGQKRRVALAAMILKRAQIWLFDEPGVGLDVFALKQLADNVQAHQRMGGIIAAVTHTDLPISFTHGLHLHAPSRQGVEGRN